MDELEELKDTCTYIPMTEKMWVLAAEIWAKRKYEGNMSGKGIDGDTLLAAQANLSGGIVITQNTRHFLGYADCKFFKDLASELNFA